MLTYMMVNPLRKCYIAGKYDNYKSHIKLRLFLTTLSKIKKYENEYYYFN